MHQVWNCGVQIVDRRGGRVSGEEDKLVKIRTALTTDNRACGQEVWFSAKQPALESEGEAGEQESGKRGRDATYGPLWMQSIDWKDAEEMKEGESVPGKNAQPQPIHPSPGFTTLRRIENGWRGTESLIGSIYLSIQYWDLAVVERVEMEQCLPTACRGKPRVNDGMIA
ncbi:uncharacterized protein AB9W97_013756 isoform 1-T1 [Spinachia spinachia]